MLEAYYQFYWGNKEISDEKKRNLHVDLRFNGLLIGRQTIDSLV